MSQNPNELLKVKHLNEFAAQLAAKLDGNTIYPLPNDAVHTTCGTVANTSDRIPLVAGQTTRVPTTVLPNGNLPFYVTTHNHSTYDGNDFQRHPTLTVSNQAGGVTWNWNHTDWFPSSSSNRYFTVFLHASAVQACTFTVTVDVPEGDGCAAFSQSYDIEIYQG